MVVQNVVKRFVYDMLHNVLFAKKLNMFKNSDFKTSVRSPSLALLMRAPSKYFRCSLPDSSRFCICYRSAVEVVLSFLIPMAQALWGSLRPLLKPVSEPL